MAVGFLVYGCISTFPLAVKNTITWVIMIVSTAITYFFFKHPGFSAVDHYWRHCNESESKKNSAGRTKTKKDQMVEFWLFGIIFIAAGIISETARKNDWPNRKPINLFENTYRMGSLVFGGGQVLMPMMYEQFSVRPEAIKEKKSRCQFKLIKRMYTGMGIVRAVPGPVFSIASFAVEWH